jgi:hypothetical protein
MTVREIKELVMRTASRLEQAEQLLRRSFIETKRLSDLPYLIIGLIPAFFEDFLVDVRSESVRRELGLFNRVPDVDYRDPFYSFDGFERRNTQHDQLVRLGRNGLLLFSLQLPLQPFRPDAEINHIFNPTSIEIFLRNFITRARAVYEAAAIGAPYVMGMILRVQRPLTGAYPGPWGTGEEHTTPVDAGDYGFPFVQIDDLSNIDRNIGLLCD